MKQRIFVKKNPPSWRSPYSVRAMVDGGHYIVSHHKTKALAEKAAKRIAKQDVRRVLGFIK